MACINVSLPEFQTLSKSFSTSSIAYVKTLRWQKENNTDAIPTYEDIVAMDNKAKKESKVKKDVLAKKIFNNLQSKGLITIVNDEVYVKDPKESLQDIDNNINKIKNYLGWNDIPVGFMTFEKKDQLTKIKINYSQISNNDPVLSKTNFKISRTKKILDSVINRLPVDYQYLTSEEALNIYEEIPSELKENVSFDSVKSFFNPITKQVILISGRVTDKIALEEVIHPFVASMKKENKKLFDDLYKESKELYPELVKFIENNYKFDVQEELVTKVLLEKLLKPTEKKKSKRFISLLKRVLEYIGNILKSIPRFLQGVSIDMVNINNNTTLDDIVNMLNTDDLTINYNIPEKMRVKYALDPIKSNVVNEALNKGNAKQKAMIYDLYSTVLDVEEEYQQFIVKNKFEEDALVVLDEETHTYRDVVNDVSFVGSTSTFNKKPTEDEKKFMQFNLDMGTIYDRVLENLILNKDQNETFLSLQEDPSVKLNLIGETVQSQFEQMKNIYDLFEENMEQFISPGDIVLPQVIIHQKAKNKQYYTNIAGAIDLLVITKEGKLRVVDLKTSKHSVMSDSYNKPWPIKGTLLHQQLKKLGGVLHNGAYRVLDEMSTRQKHQLQLAMYSRMLENMGYEIDHKQPFFTINVQIGVQDTIEGQEYTGEHSFEGINAQKVIVEDTQLTKAPLTTSEMLVDFLLENYAEKKEFEEKAESTAEQEMPEQFDYMTELDIIQNQLTQYEQILIKRKDAVKQMNNKIFIDVDRKTYLKKIDMVLSLISTAIASKDVQESRAAFTESILNAIEQSDKFIKYLSDPINHIKQEFIIYAQNAKRFADQFESINILKDAELLSPTLKDQILRLQSRLNKIAGNNGTDLSLSQQAVFDFVKQKILDNTTQEFDKGELDLLMKESMDISFLEFKTRDMSTSRDLFARVLDKIAKNKKMNVFDNADAIRRELAEVGNMLHNASEDKDPQKYHNFMTNDDGTLVLKYSREFSNKKREVRSKMFNEQDNWKEYHIIDDIESATKEQIEYNKQLAKDKRAFAEFMSPEKINDDGTIRKGDHYEYSEEFIKERAKYETLHVNRYGAFYWRRKVGLSDRMYKAFENKYYEKKKYLTAAYYKNEPTGMTVTKTKKFVKPKYVKIRDVDSSGKSQLNERYEKIMNPVDELGRVQKQYYETWMRLYNNELDKLPAGQQARMIGRMPVVMNRFAEELENKESPVIRIFAKLKQSYESIKSFFTGTLHTKAVTINEFGELVQSPPVFFTGSLKDEERLEEINNIIDDLQEKRKAGDIGYDEYNKKFTMLNAERKNIQNRPTASQLNRDLTSTLMQFSLMAENYAQMNEAENIFNAFLSVIERKNFQPKSTYLTGYYKGKEFIEKGSISGKESYVYQRVKKYLELNIWETDSVPKSLVEKVVNGILKYTSLTFVSLNPFGSLNNFVVGKIGNYIEAIGARYFPLRSYTWAEKEFKTNQLPAMIRRISSKVEGGVDIAREKFGDILDAHLAKERNSGYYDPKLPMSKWEALVDYFRMMDNKADLREASFDLNQKSFFSKMIDFSYIMQDGGEYTNQTKVGMSILHSTIVQDVDRKMPEISLYDAFVFDINNANSAKYGLKLKKGYENIMVIKTPGQFKGEASAAANGDVLFDNDFRYNLRNYIRESNKQIHGNYAKVDRMVIEGHYVGKLIAQFHKWVVPVVSARFQAEYYDENLGWVEGRARSAAKMLKYTLTNLDKLSLDRKKMERDFIDFQKGKQKRFKTEDPEKIKKLEEQLENRFKNQFSGARRYIVEITMLIGLYLTKCLIDSFDDDEEIDLDTYVQHGGIDFEKGSSPTWNKLYNILRYQADRSYKDYSIFVPFTTSSWNQLMNQIQSPIASTKVLKEFTQFASQLWSTPFAYLGLSEEDFYSNKEYVYQRGPRKGQLKLVKEWQDITPWVRTIKKWFDSDIKRDYYVN